MEYTIFNTKKAIEIEIIYLHLKNKIGKGEFMKILIVDDDLLVRELLGSCVGRLEGISVLTAENGKEALDVLSQNKDIGCILSDIQMPIMNGIEFLAHLRNNAIEIPIVFISGFCNEDQKGIIDESNLVFFQKPINFSALVKFIKDIVNNQN